MSLPSVIIFPDGAVVAQVTVNHLVGGSNPAEDARIFAGLTQW